MTAAHDLRTALATGERGESQTQESASAQALRAAFMELRNPVGSLGLAVDMVLALVQSGTIDLPEQQRQNCQEILRALQTSAKQLRTMILAVDPSQNHAFVAATAASVQETPANQSPRAPTLVPTPHAPARTSVMSPAMAPTSVGQPKPAPIKRHEPAHKSGAQDAYLHEVLQRLEVMVVTRSSVPVTMLVDAPVGLTLHMTVSELLRALTMAVEVAAGECLRGSAAGSVAVVEVQARGDASEVVIDVSYQGEPLAPELLAVWLVRHEPSGAAEPGSEEEALLIRSRELVHKLGGVTEHERVGQSSTLRLRFSTAI